MDWDLRAASLTYDQNGLISVIAQDYETKEVLMFAYASEEAVRKTLETGKVHYYSRSRKKLWLKGEESGHVQRVRDILYDCDGDCLLILVEQTGGACHTGHRSCFYRSLKGNHAMSEKVFDPEKIYGWDKSARSAIGETLEELYGTIMDRKNNPVEGSYTHYLFEKGIDKICKKIGEESAEVIIASKNEGNADLIGEIADLMYHLSVLMVQRGVEWEEVAARLNGRRKTGESNG